MNNTDWANTIVDQNLLEITKGGGLSPCPFCSIPRCQRSDYIRCSRCGINWLEGEDLNTDPKVDRYKKVCEEAQAEFDRNKSNKKK